MRLRNSLMSAVLGLGLAAALGTVPASAATPHSGTAVQHFASGQKDSAQANRAFFEAVLKSAAKRHAAHPDAAVTITYDASQAPTFASEIADAVSIWDSSVTNVQIEPASGNADFSYTEGDDPADGSYAETDGHGHGTIFIDYSQAQVYNPTRILAHETGHVLGLADDYTGPCSEIMSGHGPGPSCQNTHPDANEIAEVNALWADGFGSAVAGLS